MLIVLIFQFFLDESPWTPKCRPMMAVSWDSKKDLVTGSDAVITPAQSFQDSHALDSAIRTDPIHVSVPSVSYQVSGTNKDKAQYNQVQKCLMKISLNNTPTMDQVSTNTDKLFNVSLLNSSGSVPKYTGLTGTALCFAMNPTTGNMVQIRALLDSGANLTMLNRSVARAIGLTGRNISINNSADIHIMF